LHLFAHALDFDLGFDDELSHGGVLALRSGSVELASDFLQQEIELSSHGALGGEECPELLEVTIESHHFLADVGAVGHQSDLTLEPLRVERRASGEQAIESFFEARSLDRDQAA
jgi:hypothetical protein